MSAVDTIHLDFETSGLWLLSSVLGVILFCIALDLRVDDFRRVARAPRAALVGLTGQIVLLPAITALLIVLVDPPPSVALGMLVVSACPGGSLSNALTYLARGDVALSVSMTAVSSSLAPLTTPLQIAAWSSVLPSVSGLARSVALDPAELFAQLLAVLALPLVLGMSVGTRWPALAARVRKPLRYLFGLVFAVLIVGALVRNAGFLSLSLWPVLVLVVGHNASAFAIGYLAACLARLPEAQRRTITIEVGIQNSGLALVLIFSFFEGLGGMAVVAALWGVWHLLGGAALVFLWNARDARLAAGGIVAEHLGPRR